MLCLVTILLTVSGVLTQDSYWGVKYPDNLICAVRGFNVSIPCSYYYPKTIHQVTQMLWCSMNTNTGQCVYPPYVYNSSSNTKSDFNYVGNDKSDCSLLIHNVQCSYSGVYKFRFITNEANGNCTGEPGVTLQVTDLKVSLIRLSGNGALKEGDSLNLTCDVNCTHSSSQFVWSKNNEQLNTSGPVLHFPDLTVRDSGNYTCTWKTNKTSGSKTVNLHVKEDENQWKIWIIVLVTAGVISIIVSGTVIYKKRSVHAEQQKEDDSAVYANVQPQKDNRPSFTNAQQEKNGCASLANVQKQNDSCAIYENVQQQMKGYAIYANVH